MSKKQPQDEYNKRETIKADCMNATQISTQLSTLNFFSPLKSPLKSLNLSGVLCFMQCFYRAMHFSAKRGIAIACRMSVCL